MIVYGSCVGSDEQYLKYCLPGIRSSCGEDNEDRCVLRVGEPGKNTSIFGPYNELLQKARETLNVEALVLLHTDVELQDYLFEAKVRAAMSMQDVGIVGAIGGMGSGCAWWEGRRNGSARDIPSGLLDFGFDKIDVNTVDGLLLILSPWAIANLSFDEEMCPGFHGYDTDICRQARVSSKRVIVQPFNLMHHTAGGYGGGYESFQRADAAFRKKWGVL